MPGAGRGRATGRPTAIAANFVTSIIESKMYPQAVSISSDLIQYLRDLYVTSFNDIVVRNGNAENINGFTRHAIPAYIIATSAVEAFLNEMFLSPAGRSFFKNISDDTKYWEWLEKVELPYKLILIPQLFLNRTFATNKPPYQDMKELIKLRNELIHYKMAFKEPNYVKDMKQKKIALDDVGTTWTHNVSSLKGIWWAHNTICATIQELISFSTPETHPLLAQLNGHNFYDPWPESFKDFESIISLSGSPWPVTSRGA